MKKRYLILFLCCFQNNFSQNKINQDSIVKIIESRISLPSTPNYKIDITNFGANANGLKDCKKSFDKAMKACSNKKGGTIIVPKGNYKINGPIHFVSNVRLHLEEGAKLIFGSNPKDYSIVLTSWEGTSLYNYSPMIYGNKVSNIAITGTGIIDGEGHGLWATWKPLEKK